MQKNILQFLLSGNFSAKGHVKNVAKNSVATVPFASVLNLQNMNRGTLPSFENMNVHLSNGINPSTPQGKTEASPLKIIDFTFGPVAADFETANIPGLPGNSVLGDDPEIFAAFLNKNKKNHFVQGSGTDQPSAHVISINKIKAAEEDQKQVLQEQIAVVVPEADIKLLFTKDVNHFEKTDATENLSKSEGQNKKSIKNKMMENGQVNRNSHVAVHGSEFQSSKLKVGGAAAGQRVSPNVKYNFPGKEHSDSTIAGTVHSDENPKKEQNNSPLATARKTGNATKGASLLQGFRSVKKIREAAKTSEQVILNRKVTNDESEATVRPSRVGQEAKTVLSVNSAAENHPKTTAAGTGIFAAKSKGFQASESVKMQHGVPVAERSRAEAEPVETANLNTKTAGERVEASVPYSRGEGIGAKASGAKKSVADRLVREPGLAKDLTWKTKVFQDKVTVNRRPAFAAYGKKPLDTKVMESATPNKRTASEKGETSAPLSRGEKKVATVSGANNSGKDRLDSTSGELKAFAAKVAVSKAQETVKMRSAFAAFEEKPLNAKVMESAVSNKRTAGEKIDTSASLFRKGEKVATVSGANNSASRNGPASGTDEIKVTNKKLKIAELKEIKIASKMPVDPPDQKGLQIFPEKDSVHKTSQSFSAGKISPAPSTFDAADKASQEKTFTIENKVLPEKHVAQANTAEHRKAFVLQNDSEKNMLQTQTSVSAAVLKTRIENVLKRRGVLQNATFVRGITVATDKNGHAIVNVPNSGSPRSQGSMQHKSDGSKKQESLFAKPMITRLGKSADNALPLTLSTDVFGTDQRISSTPAHSILPNKPIPATVSALSYWIADGAKLLMSHKESFLSVKAESAELGRLVIQMGHENKKIDITIHVQSEQSKMLLENSLPELKQQLAQKDMLLSNIRVLINDKPERRFSGGSKFNDRKWQEERKRKTGGGASQLNDKIAMDIRRIESRWSTYQAVA